MAALSLPSLVSPPAPSLEPPDEGVPTAAGVAPALAASLPGPVRALASRASFTENAGQVANADVRFAFSSGGVRAGFGLSEVTFVAGGALPPPAAGPVLLPEAPAAPPPSAALRLTFEGARLVEPEPRGEAAHPTYFLRDGLSARARSFAELAYPGLYPGVDLVYRASEQGPKYEFHLAAGADLSAIGLTYHGADAIALSANGDLEVRAGAASLTDSAPRAWLADGTPVACAFALRGPFTAGFSCPAWDGALPLTLDPLVFSTMLGGSSSDYIYGAGFDSAGMAYLAGYSQSGDFPTTPGAYDTTPNTGYDVVVVKIDPAGPSIVYATFIGGSSTDYAFGLAVDANGSAIVTGYTSSSNYPTTPGALNNTKSPPDAILTKLSPDGASLNFSTYLGGSSSDYAQGLALDAAGSIVVAGYTYSTNFPVTPGAPNSTLRSGPDAFLAKFNDTGGLVFASYFGGTSTDLGSAAGADPQGGMYLAGYTFSSNLPVTGAAFDATPNGGYDGFVVKFDANGTAVTYATYLGGLTTDYVWALVVDANGSATVGGATYSSDFPVTMGAFDGAFNAGTTQDGYVTRLDPAGGTLSFSTFLGGASYDEVYGLALGANGTILATGYTNSGDFPVRGPTNISTIRGSYDAFASRLSWNGRSMDFSTFYGGSSTDYGRGIAEDPNGTTILFGGYTYSINFPRYREVDATFSSPEGFAVAYHPRWPLVTIIASRPGILVTVNGTNFTAPFTFSCEGGTRLLSVPSPQVNNTTRYLFASWGDGAPNTRAVNCSADFTLALTVRPEHLITLNTSPPGFLLNVNGTNVTTPRSYWWPEGSNQTVQAFPLQTAGDIQYAFAGWSDAGGAAHNYTVALPENLTANYDIWRYRATVTTSPPGLELVVDGAAGPAPFTSWWDAGSSHTVELLSPQSGSPGTRYLFDRWSDGGSANHSVVADAPLVLTATFLDEFLVTLATDPPGLEIVIDGVPTVTPVTSWWPNGTIHDLGVAEGEVEVGPVRYAFSAWSDPGSPPQRTVRADGPWTYEARFVASAYKAAVDTVPAGLNVTVDGTTAPAPAVLWWRVGTVHTVSAPTPQTVGSVRYSFARWDDGGQLSHGITATGPVTLAASFSLAFEFVIDTEPAGLGVRVDGQLKTAPEVVWWLNGTTHAVGVSSPQATLEDTKYVFASWSDGLDQNHSALVTGPSRLVARFDAWYKLTVTSQYVLPSCGSPDCWYVAGSTATFSVTTPRATGAGAQERFVAWTGDSNSTLPTSTLAMDGPKRVVAQWRSQFFLTVSTPYGESVGTGWHDVGSTASISVAPTELRGTNSTLRFIGWSGLVGSQLANSTVLVESPRTVTALWEEVPDPVEAPPIVTDSGGSGGGLPVLPLALGAAGAGGAATLLFMMRRRRGEAEDEELAAAAPTGAAPAAAPEGPVLITEARAPEPALPEAPAPPPVPPKPPSKPASPVMRPVRKAQAPAASPTASPCPKCGSPVEVGWLACPDCGLDLVWG